MEVEWREGGCRTELSGYTKPPSPAQKTNNTDSMLSASTDDELPLATMIMKASTLPSPSVVDEVRAKMAHRKRMMNIEEEFFTNKNGDVRDECKKTLHLNMSLSSNPTFVGTYPKVRELIQNAIDYLGLCVHGIRKKTVDVEVVNLSQENDYEQRIIFSVDETPLLELDVLESRLAIYQHLTAPLEKAILQNPVVDPSKQSRSAAGGFGVGAKDAVRQWIHEGASVDYYMHGDLERVHWKFQASEPKHKSSVYSASREFQVVSSSKRYSAHQRIPQRKDTMSQDGKDWLKPNTLCISINATRIGIDMRQVYSKIPLFWDATIDGNGKLHLECDCDSDLSKSLVSHNGDVMCDPSVFNLHSTLRGVSTQKVAAGVYSMGLHVCDDFFRNCVYLAGSNSPCSVKRRDRNTIDNYMMHRAVSKLFINVLHGEDAENAKMLKSVFQKQYFFANITPTYVAAKDTGFYNRALSIVTIRELTGLCATTGCFVDRPETTHEAVKLKWAADITLQKKRAHVLVLDPNVGAGIFNRTSADEVASMAIQALDRSGNGDDAPLYKAFQHMMAFFGVKPEHATLKHSDALSDEIYHVKPRYSPTVVFAANTSHLSIKSLQSILLILMKENCAVNEDKVHAFFGRLYTLPLDASPEAILELIRSLFSRPAPNEKTKETVTDTESGSSAQPTVETVFSTLKRALESNGLDLVWKSARVV